MDEQPVQLIKETRKPIEATTEHPKRVDYEYERAGTANTFMFTEPLSGWREATARKTKTKVDWATEMARLLEGRYAECEQVILVSDNLNTHTKAHSTKFSNLSELASWFGEFNSATHPNTVAG